MKALVLVLTCSCAAPSFTSKYNIGVFTYGNEISRSDFDEATYIVMDLLEKAKPSVYTKRNMSDTLKQTTLKVYAIGKLVDCPSADGKPCEGISNKDTIIYHHQDCLSKTAFAHELIHVIRFRIEGDADPEHADFALFGWGKSVETLAYLALKCADEAAAWRSRFCEHTGN